MLAWRKCHCADAAQTTSRKLFISTRQRRDYNILQGLNGFFFKRHCCCLTHLLKCCDEYLLIAKTGRKQERLEVEWRFKCCILIKEQICIFWLSKAAFLCSPQSLWIGGRDTSCSANTLIKPHQGQRTAELHIPLESSQMHTAGVCPPSMCQSHFSPSVMPSPQTLVLHTCRVHSLDCLFPITSSCKKAATSSKLGWLLPLNTRKVWHSLFNVPALMITLCVCLQSNDLLAARPNSEVSLSWHSPTCWHTFPAPLAMSRLTHSILYLAYWRSVWLLKSEIVRGAVALLWKLCSFWLITI